MGSQSGESEACSAVPSELISHGASTGTEAIAGEDVRDAVAQIWAETLGVAEVDEEASFFELGGHSVAIIGMLERLREVGLSAELQDVFYSPTLAEFLKTVRPDRQRGAASPDGLEPSEQEITAVSGSVPGGTENLQDIYPLVPLQEGMLFHHRISERHDAYGVALLLEMRSRGEITRFAAGLQAVVDRYDILRSAFRWEGLDRPLQIVLRRVEVPVEWSRSVLEGEPDVVLDRMTAASAQRIDLSRAPLLRLIAARSSKRGRLYVALKIHHAVCDATSVTRLLEEACAHSKGRSATLPERVSYRDHVMRVLSLETTSDAEAFFRGKLGDVSESTAPFGILEVQGNGDGVREARRTVSPRLTRRLRDIAKARGVTAAAVVHAAFALAVARMSGRKDVVLGTVLLTRRGDETRDGPAIGMFVNTLPLRVNAHDGTAGELVDVTQRELVELLAHEHASLALAQRCSAIAASMPLFTALLNYRHGSTLLSDAGDGGMPGLRVLGQRSRTNYPLTVTVDDRESVLVVTAQTDPRIDASRVVEYVECAMEKLVCAIEDGREEPIGSLDVLPEAEWKRTVLEWNETSVPYGKERCIHELFEERARHAGDAIAVVHGKGTMSYGELNRRANQVAHGLRAMGVGASSRVAVCLDRGVDLIVSLLGVLKAGAAYVPLDPSYPSGRLAYLLADSAAAVVLTGGRARKVLAEALRELDRELPIIDMKAGVWSEQSCENLPVRSVGLSSSDLAYIIYTSGSTGRPKGIAVAHAPVINLMEWVNRSFEVGPQDALLFVTSIGFDLSVYDIFGVLAAGARVWVADEEMLADPQRLAGVLCREGITFWDSAPAALQLLVPFLRDEQGSGQSRLRLIFNSGDWIPLSLPAQMKEMFPRARFIALGGATEATVWSNWYEVDEIAPHWKSIPYGRPIQNAHYYILDDGLRPAPIGVAGDLYIGGECLAEGYTDEGLTRERFLASPFMAGERLYRTGDLARYLPEGDIEFLGRNDFQVKIRGYRIELGEIEAQLRRCAGVREAVVVARAEAGGEKRLVAYYTVQDGSAVSPEGLKEQLSRVLAGYMVPAAYVRLEQLPLTGNGKLDRKGLPAPDDQAYVKGQYEPPQGPTEQRIAQLWQELLGVQRVGRQDNFFELGGHSILATVLSVRIQSLYSTELPLQMLFDAPTLSQLASRVDELRYAAILASPSGNDSVAAPDAARGLPLPSDPLRTPAASEFVEEGRL